MRRRLTVTVVLMLLFSVLPLTSLIAPATANPFGLSFPSIRIVSPPDPPNRYENSTVSLEIDVRMLNDDPELCSISYSLDGAHFIPVSFRTLETGWSTILVGYTAKAKVQLTDLSEGNHKIVACAKDAEGKELVKTSRNFTVNSHYQVTVIEVLSPQNRAYSSGEIPLVFTVNGEFGNGTYHILKPINAASGIGGTEIKGNTTLIGLPDGSYQVLLYIAAEGKGASRAYAEFIVNSGEAINSTEGQTVPNSQPESPALTLIIAFTFVFCVAGVGLLVYFTKLRPPNRSNQKFQLSKTYIGDNMIRKAFARPIVWAILILTLAITTAPFALANPFMPIGSSSNEPLPPSISIQLPSETGKYSTASDVWLNFMVKAPITQWHCPKSLAYGERDALTFGEITQARFSVDGTAESNAELTNTVYHNRITTPHEYHFGANLGLLSAGPHVVTIMVEGWGYYGNLTHSAFSDFFSVYANDTDKIGAVQNSAQVTFVVQQGPNISSPSPTDPKPEEEYVVPPSSVSAEEQAENKESFPTELVLTIAVTIAALTGAVLIVYYRKIKQANTAN